MVTTSFDSSLGNLKSGPVQVLPGGAYPEPGCASVLLTFGNGSRLHAQYWRLIQDGERNLSSFDHQQKYGLPAPIDAIAHLQSSLQGQLVTDARVRAGTADLLFDFADNSRLEVFSFTGYEDWEIHFPDGTGGYSNHVR